MVEDNLRRPDFFIVGAPKCGTTSMREYLRQHPDVFMAQGEPHFFGSDTHSKLRRMTEEEYLNRFSEARDEKRVGEKSPSYLRSKKAPLEIKKFCPHVKIIIQIRNPVDVLYSLHSGLLRGGGGDIVDFEEALDAQDDRRKGLRIPKHALKPPIYSEIPLYTKQIKRYVNVFGWEQIHIVVFDDLVKNTLDTYREVLRFLEVDDKFTPDFKIPNPGNPRRSKLFHKFMKSSLIVNTAKFLLPDTVCYSIGQMLFRWNTSSKPRPPMEKHVRKRLQKQFEPEVERLSELLDRDLTHWCKE